MSKHANPTLIGGFVVGAIALLIAAILILSSGYFLTPKNRFIVYFEASVNGLNIGAPVKLKGVQIGRVTDILVQYDAEENKVRTPVIVEVEPDRLRTIGAIQQHEEPEIETMIERGLRAQLQLQSLVTGQLYIEVNFYPDTPIRLVGGDTPISEIPSIPSSKEEIENTIDEAIAQLRKLPVQDIVQNLQLTLQHLEQILSAPEIRTSLDHLNATLSDLRTMVGHINGQAAPLSADLKATLADTRTLMQNLNNQVIPLASNTTETLTKAQAALASLEKTAGQNSPLYDEMQNTLTELSSAARSLRLLADYLQRNPETLIYGKGRFGGQ